MDNWVVKDIIKRQIVKYSVGEQVVLFRRKSNGYPKFIKDDVYYTIKKVEDDSIYISIHSSDGVGWLQPIKVHKTYMMSKSLEREIKINSILDETSGFINPITKK
jgi:hypothetical protein